MIRQFDVVRNPISAWRTVRPFLISVQHDWLRDSKRRLLAPLVVPSAIKPTPRLNPLLQILDQQFFLMPDDLVTLGVRRLSEAIANMESDRHRILAALDLVFTGI